MDKQSVNNMRGIVDSFHLPLQGKSVFLAFISEVEKLGKIVENCENKIEDIKTMVDSANGKSTDNAQIQEEIATPTVYLNIDEKQEKQEKQEKGKRQKKQKKEKPVSFIDKDEFLAMHGEFDKLEERLNNLE